MAIISVPSALRVRSVWRLGWFPAVGDHHLRLAGAADSGRPCPFGAPLRSRFLKSVQPLKGGCRSRGLGRATVLRQKSAGTEGQAGSSPPIWWSRYFQVPQKTHQPRRIVPSALRVGRSTAARRPWAIAHRPAQTPRAGVADSGALAWRSVFGLFRWPSAHAKASSGNYGTASNHSSTCRWHVI